WRNVVPGTSGHCGLVEFIDLILIFGHKAPVNGRWIRFPLLYPEECPFAITKSPQIRMTVFALVRHEECCRPKSRRQVDLFTQQQPQCPSDDRSSCYQR